MKFVCRPCETYMTLSGQETVGEGSLGVTFACPKCGHSFSMVTNPGETQMVYSLGVKVGGREGERPPLEMTREALLSGHESRATSHEPRPQGGCPFPAMLEGSANPSEPAEIGWSEDARLRLERIPLYIRPMIQKEIERVARGRGLQTITEEIMKEIREEMGAGR